MRTSLYSILCIVVRLGAIILAVQALLSLPSLWGAIETGQYDEATRRALIGFVGAFMALMAVLWIYPGVLARLAASQASGQVFESPLDAAELQYIAFAIVGVFFAITGLSDLFAVGVRMVFTMNISDSGYDGLRAQEITRALAAAIKTAMGIGLALGARGLVGWLRRVRERGLPVVRFDNDKPDEADPERSS
jgi:hypothetical protein